MYKQLKTDEDWELVGIDVTNLKELLAAMSQAFKEEKSVCMLFGGIKGSKPHSILLAGRQCNGEIIRVETHRILGDQL